MQGKTTHKFTFNKDEVMAVLVKHYNLPDKIYTATVIEKNYELDTLIAEYTELVDG